MFYLFLNFFREWSQLGFETRLINIKNLDVWGFLCFGLFSMKFVEWFFTCLPKFRQMMECDVVIVSHDVFNMYIVNRFQYLLLKVYLAVNFEDLYFSTFFSYSHSSDCRNNLRNIYGMEVLRACQHCIYWQKLYQHLHYSYLELFTVNLTSLANTSNPGLKQSIT